MNLPALLSRPLRRLALLGVVPVMLGVGLGIGKWRADHPPISKADLIVRAVILQPQWVYINGAEDGWRRLVGRTHRAEYGLMIQDRQTRREIIETLRCTETWVPPRYANLQMMMHLEGLTRKGPHDTATGLLIGYVRDAEGSYLYFRNASGVWPRYVVVQPRFAPRFEALIARLMAHEITQTHPGTTSATSPTAR